MGKVEFHCEVRIITAAFEKEKLERMVGVVGEGVVAPEVGIFLFGIIFGHLFLQRSGLVAVDGDFAVGEVDGRCGLIVDAAEVGHEDAVDEDPDVVVTRKLEGHGLVAALGGHAAVALDKARGHSHAEIVADRGIIRLDGGLGQGTVIECENRLRVGEGEELALDSRVAVGSDRPFVVEREGVRLLVKVGVVGGLIFASSDGAVAGADVIVAGVVVVIAVPVDLQEAVDVPIGFLADGTGGRAALGRSVDLLGLIKEIGQRLLCGCIRRPVCTVCFVGSQDGIAAGKAVLHDAGKRGTRASPLVDVVDTGLRWASVVEF